MNYLLELTHEAEKDMGRLDVLLEKRIRECLRELSANPYSPRISKPLKMAKGERSARIGNWRVIYEVHDNENIIKILTIRPRQKAYKKR